MNPNSVVIVNLHTPREKVWGILLEINPSGVTMRGIDLNSFDHFISQVNQLDAERVGLPTIFFPMTRVERISLDEPSGSIPSMSENLPPQNRPLPNRIPRPVRLSTPQSYRPQRLHPACTLAPPSHPEERAVRAPKDLNANLKQTLPVHLSPSHFSLLTLNSIQ